MKNLFPEFNQPSDEQFSELWKDALISFDANVLLNVFQYGHSTLHTFMDLLDQLQGRLWLTHQAAYEYQKNRNSRIRAQEVALKTPPALAKLEEVYRNIKNLHHPIIDYEDLSIAANDLIKAIQKPMQSSESMDKYRQRCAEMHARINTLFDGKVGDPYSPCLLYTSTPSRGVKGRDRCTECITVFRNRRRFSKFSLNLAGNGFAHTVSWILVSS